MGCIKIKLLVVFRNKKYFLQMTVVLIILSPKYMAFFWHTYSYSLFSILFPASSLNVYSKGFLTFSLTTLALSFPSRSPYSIPILTQVHLQLPSNCAESRLSVLQVTVTDSRQLFFVFSLSIQGLSCCHFLIWRGYPPDLSVSWFYIQAYLGRIWKPQWLKWPVKVTIQLNGVFLSNSLVAYLKINTNIVMEAVSHLRNDLCKEPPSS